MITLLAYMTQPIAKMLREIVGMQHHLQPAKSSILVQPFTAALHMTKDLHSNFLFAKGSPDSSLACHEHEDS